MGSLANVVLVHGAFEDGSCWNRVIPLLLREGFDVQAVQNPLTSLADDIANTRAVIDSIDGPIVLVGHAYGGAVISGAAYGALNVTSMVYISGFAPEQGESLADILANYPSIPSSQYLRADSAGRLTLDRSRFADFFAQDLEPLEAQTMAAVQRPIAHTAYLDRRVRAAWRLIPTWYQIAEDDRMIPPAVQHWMAKRMGAQTKSVKSSHAAMVSRPAETCTLIKDAAVLAMVSA